MHDVILCSSDDVIFFCVAMISKETEVFERGVCFQGNKKVMSATQTKGCAWKCRGKKKPVQRRFFSFSIQVRRRWGDNQVYFCSNKDGRDGVGTKENFHSLHKFFQWLLNPARVAVLLLFLNSFFLS